MRPEKLGTVVKKNLMVCLLRKIVGDSGMWGIEVLCCWRK